MRGPASPAPARRAGGLPETNRGGYQRRAKKEIHEGGGGRKRLTERDPRLAAALEGQLDPVTRGDPTGPLRWTCSSAARLAERLRSYACRGIARPWKGESGPGRAVPPRKAFQRQDPRRTRRGFPRRGTKDARRATKRLKRDPRSGRGKRRCKGRASRTSDGSYCRGRVGQRLRSTARWTTD